MVPAVSIILANGAIGGAIATGDNITGVLISGNGTGTIGLLTPKKVNSLADAVSQGFTQAEEPDAYRFLSEFYSIDGTLGAYVYVMLFANTTSLVTLCDKTNANGIKKLIDFSNGTIRVVGLLRTPDADYEPVTAGFIDSDVTGALPNAKAFVADMFSKHTPLRILLAARIDDETKPVAFTPNTADNNAVGLIIGGTLADGSASIGLVLGRIAATPVHRNIGRVKDGNLPVNTLYIGTKKVQDYAGLNSLIDSGFISFTTYPQKAGYFISDDPMCTSAIDDYRILANCRVIDKAAVIAYQTFLEELKDDVELDENGNIEAVAIKSLEGTMTNNINLAMSENISGVTVLIDPAQNLAAGSTLKVKLRIQPKGYLKLIEVELGFYNPANA